jgi:hypothetical protein
MTMIPIKVSMRKSSLVGFNAGGELKSMYEVKRFDYRFFRSRHAYTVTRKDFRVNGSHIYRPWQFKGAYHDSAAKNIKLSESEQ